MHHNRQEKEFAQPSYRWHLILLIIGAFLLFLLLSSDSASAESGAPPENGEEVKGKIIINETRVENKDDNGDGGGFIPGFEAMAMVSAIGGTIILIGRKGIRRW